MSERSQIVIKVSSKDVKLVLICDNCYHQQLIKKINKLKARANSKTKKSNLKAKILHSRSILYIVLQAARLFWRNGRMEKFRGDSTAGPEN